MKKGKSLMSPREIQRMMDFILLSQADAMIRMEVWEEEYERRREEIEKQIKKAFAAIEANAKFSREAREESRAAPRNLRRRADDMKQLMKMAMRLLAHESKRLDALESGSR